MGRQAPASVAAVAPLLAGFVASGCLVGNPDWDGQSSTAASTGTSAASGMTEATSGGETQGSTADSGTTGDDPPDAGLCVPLAPVTAGDPVIDVTPSQIADLASIVAGAAPGTTIRFADGTYDLTASGALTVSSPGVVLRSASGDAANVVLDGGDTVAGVVVIAADVTIAELTIARIPGAMVEVLPSQTAAVDRLRLHRVELRDTTGFMVALGQGENVAAGSFADDGEIGCSRFVVTDAYRETHGCVSLGAIKSFGGSGWWVHDNSFEELWCPTAPSFVAVHFGYGGSDNVIERNQFRNVLRATMLGFEADAVGTRAAPSGSDCPPTSQHFGGSIRNNMFWVGGTGIGAAEPQIDAQISVWSACDADVQHNTVVNLFQGDTFSEIEHRFPDGSGSIANNLLTSTVVVRDSSPVVVAGNLEMIGLEQFVDPGGGDLHLASGATTPIDAAVVVGAAGVLDDIDRDMRVGVADVGADERVD